MAAPRFADAVAKYDEAWMALFGVPYDRTCSFRGGSRFGPRAIREASYNFETYMMDHQRDLRDVAVADLGDTPTFGASTEMVEGVTHMAADVVRAGKIPIVIGGEHNLAPPGGGGVPEENRGRRQGAPPGLPRPYPSPQGVPPLPGARVPDTPRVGN